MYFYELILPHCAYVHIGIDSGRKAPVHRAATEPTSRTTWRKKYNNMNFDNNDTVIQRHSHTTTRNHDDRRYEIINLSLWCSKTIKYAQDIFSICRILEYLPRFSVPTKVNSITHGLFWYVFICVFYGYDVCLLATTFPESKCAFVVKPGINIRIWGMLCTKKTRFFCARKMNITKKFDNSKEPFLKVSDVCFLFVASDRS